MRKLTYIGRRPLGNKPDGRLFHMFEAPNDDGSTSRTYWPKERASWFWGAQIGAIYELGDDDGVPNDWTAAKVGEVPEATRLEFQVKERALVTRLEAKKVKRSPELDVLIGQLRAARKRLAHSKRPAFDAWLLKELQMGKD